LIICEVHKFINKKIASLGGSENIVIQVEMFHFDRFKKLKLEKDFLSQFLIMIIRENINYKPFDLLLLSWFD
jgi:hypothetical protein